MDKSIEISLRLADEAMTKAKKLEERITELENLNHALQLKISKLENQKTEKATDKGVNTDNLLKKIAEQERTIRELEQALENEKNAALEFQEKQKKMEEEMKELEAAIAKGNKSVHESIKEHQVKMGEMFENLNDRNRALTEELHNARKQLKSELDAKDRKIMELENELQAEKEKIQVATNKEKEQLGKFHSKIVSFSDDIGVKKMGVIDSALFEAEAKRRSSRVGRTKTKEGLKYWENLVQDPNWNPFTIIVKDGKCAETLDKTNEDLQRLKMSNDREVYKAVKVALEEIKEHNRKGRYPVLEFWNFTKNRKATLDEGLAYLSGNSNKRMKMCVGCR